ncbi:MAG: hypothetical protein JEY99_18035 [Spirochaetales bacterium]|nr:hypothetical protein [Spirochaetales bacterium]
MNTSAASYAYIMLIFLFTTNSLIASGNSEDQIQSPLNQIDIQGVNSSELWKVSVTENMPMANFYPTNLKITTEVKDREGNTLLIQEAEVEQRYNDKEIIRTLTPVETEKMDLPENRREQGKSGPGNQSGRPQDGNSGQGNPGSRSGGGPSSGGPGEANGMRPDMEGEEQEHLEELTQMALSLWDITTDSVQKIIRSDISGTSTEKMDYIFSYPSLMYTFSDEENELEGDAWISIEKEIPLKLSFRGVSDKSLQMEIYLLPSSETGIKVSKMYYTKEVTDPDGIPMVLRGTVIP